MAWRFGNFLFSNERQPSNFKARHNSFGRFLFWRDPQTDQNDKRHSLLVRSQNSKLLIIIDETIYSCIGGKVPFGHPFFVGFSTQIQPF